MVEPAITWGGSPLYRFIHPEPVDMSADPLAIGEPDPTRDPYDANQAIPRSSPRANAQNRVIATRQSSENHNSGRLASVKVVPHRWVAIIRSRLLCKRILSTTRSSFAEGNQLRLPPPPPAPVGWPRTGRWPPRPGTSGGKLRPKSPAPG